MSVSQLLTVQVKGLNGKQTYDCGYITFGVYPQKFALAWNEEFEKRYEKMYKDFFFEGYTENETKRWNEICSDDLDIFLNQSDCEGKITLEECKKIYNAMKDLKVDMKGHNYGIMEPYDMHQQWFNMFKHCNKKRVNMYFC